MKKNLVNLKMLSVFLTVSFPYIKTYTSLFENNYINVLMYLYFALSIFIIAIQIIRIGILKNKLIPLFLFIIMAILSSIIANNGHLINQILLAILFLYDDDKQMIKYFLVSSVLMFCLTLSLSSFGILESSYRGREFSDTIRTDLGFGHPNRVFLYILPIVFSYYYLYGNKKNFKIITLLISCIMYYFTDSRTGFYLIIFFLLYTSIKNVKLDNLIKRITPFLLPFTTVLTLILTNIYNNGGLRELSYVLSGRLYYINYYIQNNSLVSFFGNNSAGNNLIDNFPIYLMIEMGSIIYIVYCYIFYKGTKLIKDQKIINIIFCFLVYGLFERFVFTAGINFTIIILFKAILNNKGAEYEKSINYCTSA